MHFVLMGPLNQAMQIILYDCPTLIVNNPAPFFVFICMLYKG